MPFTFHWRRPGAVPPRIALFPGAWNPPTIAHVAMARAARALVDEVVWTLPRAFPHKSFTGADSQQRLEMITRIAEAEDGCSVAVTDAGLYFDIGREARAALGPQPEILLLCGRDAAERIATWDYGRPGVFEEMLEEFPLLAAARAGDYLPHPRHAGRIVRLTLPGDFDDVSSTELRDRIARGVAWRHLAHEAVVPLIERIWPSHGS